MVEIARNGEIGPQLTDWQNEPSVRQLKLDLENAKTSHDEQITKIKKWSDLLHVRGSVRPKRVKNRSGVQPKLIRRQAEWRYSALTEPFLGSNKIFKVSPTSFEDPEAARQNELVLNWQFRTKLNRVKLIDDYVRSTVDEGTSILRLGWKRATVKVKEKVPVYTHYALETEEQAQAFQQALALSEEDPRNFELSMTPEVIEAVKLYKETGQPTYAEQTGEEEVEIEKIIENRPTVEVMNPQNVIIDPSCEGDIDKALFVAVSFETNKAELLKEGKRYKNLDKINWEANTPLTQTDHESRTPDTFNHHDATRKKVVAYEYWGFYDIKGDGVLVPIVATWIGDVMIRMELNPFPDQKLPFVVVPYLPVKRELYGEPDAELLEDNQAILGAVSRGLVDLLGRSANGQQGFAKGMLDPLNRRRYENGQDYEFNPNMPPQAGLIEHKYPEIPQSALLMLNLQNQEAEALTGVKSFAGGMSGEAYGDVAAGIRGVLDAASKREMAILRRLAKGMSEVGRKIIAMNQEFLSEQEVVRLTNEEFVTVNREDLAGEFDLEVDISTAEVDNAKSQDLAFMLQTIGPNEDPEMRRMILAEIAELKRMPALARKIRSFKPEPDPMMEQVKQLEMRKLQAEVAELESKVALNQAKAKEAQSKAEKTDLDYVEQETGTSHAREMERNRAQAEGNQDLEVTKALLRSKKFDEIDPDVEAAVGFNELSRTKSDMSNVGPAPIDTSYAPAELDYQMADLNQDPAFY